MYQKGDYIDAYRVLEQLVVGEQSQIYLVYCESLDCHLVIKCACTKEANISSPNTEAFIYHARIMHQFADASHIVKLMHIGNVEPSAGNHPPYHPPYIVMPYYQQNLAEYLASLGGRLSAYQSIPLITQVLIAIDTLHKEGVLHLDIKPQNLLLDESMCLFLNDFDAAYVLEGSQLAKKIQPINSAAKFTHEYASPELKTGQQDLSESADLYSVGVLWCRLLLGKEALAGLSQEDEREVIISTLTETTPSWMKDLIAELLTFDPKQRPKSAIYCIDVISRHTEQAEDFKTMMMPDDAMMSTLSLALSSEIETILLTDGAVNTEKAIRLSKSFDGTHKKIAPADIFALEATVKQQLITNKNMSNWFEWCELLSNKALICTHDESKTISLEEMEQLLKEGQDSRQDNPQAALMLLMRKLPKQTAMLNNKSTTKSKFLSIGAKKFVIPTLVVAMVFAYWLLNNTIFEQEFSKAKDIYDESPSTFIENQTKSNQIGKETESVEKIISNVEKELNNQITIQIKSERGASEELILIRIIAANANEQKDIDAFYAMQTEVSWALFDLCVSDGACSQRKKYSTKASTNIMKHPVTEISWYEADQQFIPWINRKVDGTFNLPSLRQWQQLADWPQSIALIDKLRVSTNCKNCTHSLTNKIWLVGSGKPNKLGLYDVYGNVQEWLSDCWHDELIERCDQAIVVGGSWYNKAQEIQQNHLTKLLKHAKTPTTGFRLIYFPNE